MSVTYRELSLTLVNSANQPITSGTAVISPSQQLTDVTDGLTVGEPVLVNFAQRGTPVITLVTTDNANISPSSWYYTVEFSGMPSGAVFENQSFAFPYGPGTPLDFSAVTTVVPAPASSEVASINSPGFTGIPTAPTASPGTDTSQLATCAFVEAAGGGGGGITIDTNAADIQPTGVTASAGGKGEAADAEHVHAQNFGGLFGDGSDGAVVFNGTNTYAGFATLSGSGPYTYSLIRDVFATSVSISSNVTVLTAVAGDSQPNRIFVMGTLTNSGTISANGVSAVNATAANPGNSYSGGGLSGAGTTTTGGGGNGSGAARFGGGGSSGAGGNGSSGNGGAALTTTSTGAYAPGPVWRQPGTLFLPQQAFIAQAARSPYVPGGGGGGGDGTNSGGGGGGGGGFILVAAWAVVNNGTITANGGSGFTPVTGNCGGGGGGGGGLVVLYTLSAVTGSGSITVNGGSKGSGVGSGTTGAVGTAGTYLNVLIQ